MGWHASQGVLISNGYGALAQLGERYNGIVEVSGSIPLGSTILPLRGFKFDPSGGVAEWLKAADCKSARDSVRWFESSPFHHLCYQGRIRRSGRQTGVIGAVGKWFGRV